MARSRQDKNEQEWLEFGGYLIACLEKNQYKSVKRRGELKRKTAKLLKDLEEAVGRDKGRLIEDLNALKNDYGDAWIAFTKKIRQQPIDQNRVRTDLSPKSDQYFQSLMMHNNEESIPKTYEHLYMALESLGIEKIDQLYDIREFLFKYQNHDDRHPQESLHSESKDDFDFGLALQSITTLLSKRKINSFHELDEALKKRVKENNTLEKYKILEKYLETRNIDVDVLIKKEREY